MIILIPTCFLIYFGWTEEVPNFDDDDVVLPDFEFWIDREGFCVGVKNNTRGLSSSCLANAFLSGFWQKMKGVTNSLQDCHVWPPADENLNKIQWHSIATFYNMAVMMFKINRVHNIMIVKNIDCINAHA